MDPALKERVRAFHRNVLFVSALVLIAGAFAAAWLQFRVLPPGGVPPARPEWLRLLERLFYRLHRGT